MKLRQCYIKDNLCFIPLQNGQEAFTDKEYFDLVSKHNWCNSKTCIITSINNKTILLHKFLFPEFKTTIKYINGNYFDCRKENITLIDRECFIKDNLCYIPLANCDKFAVCDADRFEEVNKYNWCIRHKNSLKRTFCVITDIKCKTVRLHRFLYPQWKIIDHINRDTLDNRAINLREVTHQQNSMNRRSNYNNKSGYKGVIYNKKALKYNARIKLNQKTLHLGTFKTKEEAALAYNEKAKELFGEYAFLNVIS